MKNTRHSPIEIERLRPLLEEIARELDDRYIATRRLARRVRLADRSGEPPARCAALSQELAEHRRSLDAALDELAALGCVAELGLPTIVRVPGPDGTFASGRQVAARYEPAREPAGRVA